MLIRMSRAPGIRTYDRCNRCVPHARASARHAAQQYASCGDPRENFVNARHHVRLMLSRAPRTVNGCRDSTLDSAAHHPQSTIASFPR
jgi:hypothetical protein